MKPNIINRSKHPVPRTFLAAWVKDLSRLLAQHVEPKRFRRKELGLIFLDAREVRKLNRTYRNKDKPTDVLSFESDSPETLGELVICPSIISKQAREHGLRVREELGYMVIHGVLHLLGYDHERSRREAEEMFAIQDQIFERLLRGHR